MPALTKDLRPSSRAVARPAKVATLLAISPYREDHAFLRSMFRHSHWRILGTASGREALPLLRQNSVRVVICEKDLPDCTWRAILEELSRFEDPPLLIVTSHLADDHLWAEVLNLGGYDVLMKPFDPTEVVRVVNLAGRHGAGDSENLPAAASA